jgi:hypothetical protein
MRGYKQKFFSVRCRSSLRVTPLHLLLFAAFRLSRGITRRSPPPALSSVPLHPPRHLVATAPSRLGGRRYQRGCVCRRRLRPCQEDAAARVQCELRLASSSLSL